MSDIKINKKTKSETSNVKINTTNLLSTLKTLIVNQECISGSVVQFSFILLGLYWSPTSTEVWGSRSNGDKIMKYILADVPTYGWS